MAGRRDRRRGQDRGDRFGDQSGARRIRRADRPGEPRRRGHRARWPTRTATAPRSPRPPPARATMRRISASPSTRRSSRCAPTARAPAPTPARTAAARSATAPSPPGSTPRGWPGAKVINMSLGGDPAGQFLLNAIGRAVNAGIVIVISAGNDGEDAAKGANADPFALSAAQANPGRVIIAGALDTDAHRPRGLLQPRRDRRSNIISPRSAAACAPSTRPAPASSIREPAFPRRSSAARWR